ncbi:MAG: HIT domain-containing protein [Planctomycetaceae bacterium]|jgi:ATP adenylyltransferase|nr:HIT domain-containing protein [Planctomycetaceae bacterium]
MEIIWAPWRLSYIVKEEEAEKKERETDTELPILPEGDCGCFICQAAVDSDNVTRYVVGSSDKSIAILNRYPYNNGHLLVAPKSHRASLELLTSEERMDLMEQITHWVGVLKQILKPEGFNVGLNLGHVAGAGLPGHLHWHIVPRWNGDTNFMSAIGQAKVIPQSLEALREMILETTNNYPKK